MLATIVAIAAVCGFIGYSNQSIKQPLNALAIANVEALSQGEYPYPIDSKEKLTTETEEDETFVYDPNSKVTIRYYSIVTIVDCFGNGSIKCTPDYTSEDCVEYISD